ncbi:nucleoside hydrolase [Actinomadura sp. HBU206391]|uniref:nucleoside hydrolase n=1 Tax=Actinomadura sp. HBU206391 TaxID=2731692 RepID=UPI00164FF37A|nr:nucleoside hydrolase [Actinomadura sp. HBU206391]MBC6456940.1 nucleoside hydrolase [Actinomadura sp. HBU206391]
MRKILLDCDTGIDDAITILYLASLVKAGEADLVGVGTVHGNVDPATGALNTLRIFEMTGIKDVPVAVGAGRPMAQDVHFAHDWHGTDGLGETHLPVPATTPDGSSAPEQIVRLARAHPGELTLIAIGPLTNLGIALLLEPDLPELIREVVIMGGAFDHPGNITTHAEANVWHDPEAADLVFAAGWPTVLVPLDATHPTAVGDEWLDRLAESTSDVAKFAVRILDFYVTAYTPTLKRRGCVIHDALAAMLAVDPSLGRYEERPVRVELRGELTRGATVWDARSLPAEDARRPVRVVVGSDVTSFQERLLATLL